MSQGYTETFKQALKKTINGITHPSDREHYYKALFSMIQDGLTPEYFEELTEEFSSIIKEQYPGIFSDIKHTLSSDFYAMHFAVCEMSKKTAGVF